MVANIWVGQGQNITTSTALLSIVFIPSSLCWGESLLCIRIMWYSWGWLGPYDHITPTTYSLRAEYVMKAGLEEGERKEEKGRRREEGREGEKEGGEKVCVRERKSWLEIIWIRNPMSYSMKFQQWTEIINWAFYWQCQELAYNLIISNFFQLWSEVLGRTYKW